MEIIALQEYTDKYVSLYEGQIRNVSDGLAQKLIEKGIVAEHDEEQKGDDLLTVTVTLIPGQTNTYKCDLTCEDVKNYFLAKGFSGQTIISNYPIIINYITAPAPNAVTKYSGSIKIRSSLDSMESYEFSYLLYEFTQGTKGVFGYNYSVDTNNNVTIQSFALRES